MNLQSVLNSHQAGRLALPLCRILHPRLGYRLACFIADRVANSKGTPLVQAIRANHWVVSGESLSPGQLDLATREVLRHTARSFYNLFHYMNDLHAMQNLIEFSTQAEYLIERSREGKEGIIVLGVHLSNFDLIARAAALRGMQAVGLSLPQPDETVEWQHDLRRRAGIEILPASVTTFRQVIRRLQAGETVLTGIDRPIPDPKYRPHFFGRPAVVPVHYIQLALRAKVPLILLAAIMGSDGIYHIMSSDYLYVKPHSDRHIEIVKNAEMVLDIAADFIGQAPQQWAIFQPVWPEIQAQVPQ